MRPGGFPLRDKCLRQTFVQCLPQTFAQVKELRCGKRGQFQGGRNGGQGEGPPDEGDYDIGDIPFLEPKQMGTGQLSPLASA